MSMAEVDIEVIMQSNDITVCQCSFHVEIDNEIRYTGDEKA